MHLTARTSEGDSHTAEATPRARAWWWVLVIVALLLIFELDRVTDSAPVQHLYYLPIIFAATRFGRRGGLAVAVAAIVSYHLANVRLISYRYAESDIVQVVLFIAVGLVAAKLMVDARRLRHLAMSDDLTGLHNLRSFEARFAQMVQAARRDRTPVSLLALDVDHLKSLNDRYGHLAGAEAVRTVGQVIAAHLPADAVACRYGGDEFVIALPRCTVSQATLFGRTLCRAVRGTAPVLAGLAFPAATLSISIGVASRAFKVSDVTPDDPDEATESLFRAADQALYGAKENGRNCVSVA